MSWDIWEVLENHKITLTEHTFQTFFYAVWNVSNFIINCLLKSDVNINIFRPIKIVK
jgi:hypothetical protein